VNDCSSSGDGVEYWQRGNITGNPQNMLIGSFSRIGYRNFLMHLAPVAVAGLLLDWLILHWVYMRKAHHSEEMKETAFHCHRLIFRGSRNQSLW
jgi:Na+/H+ antiporter NhaD/arsenite permease-like protein